MRRAIMVVGLGLLAAGAAGCLHTPIPWSPDGHWVAYTVAVRPPDPAEDVGYLFEPGRAARLGRSGPVASYRLWATRPATGASVLLEESPGPITSPGWSPDGRALAFGRVGPDGAGGNRFEVVVLEGLARRRVVAAEPVAALDAEVGRLPGQAVAWSADGRHLAVPHLDPMGLAILRADNGRVVQVIPDAFLPSWSPAGRRLAFFVRGGDGMTLQGIDAPESPPRPLLDVGQALQAPAWSRDGSSVVVLSRRPPLRPARWRRAGMGMGMGPDPFRPAPMVDPIHLVRVRADTGDSEVVRTLAPEPNAPQRAGTIEGASVAADAEAENVFYALAIEGQPHQVAWCRPGDDAIVRKVPLVDPALPIGSLALAPDGQTLAARLGAEQLSPPLFWEVGTGPSRPRLAVPDDSARLDWIITLARTARLLLADLPTARLAGGPVARPSILPLVTDLSENADLGARLRRIGQLGRPLCDRPDDAPPLDATGRRVVDEARFFFDYLREDYAEALRSLDRLEPDAATPERRLDLMTARAQVLLNKGQFQSARRTVALLEAAGGGPARRVEWTGAGYRLAEEALAGRGWPRFLAESVAQVQASLKADGPAKDDTPDAAADRPRPIIGQGLLFRRYPPPGLPRPDPPRAPDRPDADADPATRPR